MNCLLLAIAIYHASAFGLTARIVQGVTTRIPSMDPLKISGIEAYNVSANSFETLVTIDPSDHSLKPALAQSWSVDHPKRKVTVRLREGVVSHTGEKLKSVAIEKSFSRFTKAKEQAGLWALMWTDVKSIRVIDDLNFEIHFRKLTYQSFQSFMTSFRPLMPTGPFKLSGFTANRQATFQPFEKWWSGRPPNFNLTVKTVPDAQLAKQMMLKNQLDFYEVPAGAPQSRLKFLRRLDSGAGEGLWIDLNMRLELFKDPKVRRALSLLWNRQALNQKIFSGRWEVAGDAFSPKMPFYPPTNPAQYDLKKAVALLKEAGWRDEDRNSVLEKQSQGKTTELAFTLLMKSAESERWASLFQADAKKAGVKVRLKRVEEDSQWWSLLKEGKFDALASGGAVSDQVYAPSWHSRGEYAFFGFKNEEVDQWLEKLEYEFDLKKRAEIQRQLILKVREMHSQIPGLFSRHRVFLISPRLAVDAKSPHHAWKWRLKD